MSDQGDDSSFVIEDMNNAEAGERPQPAPSNSANQLPPSSIDPLQANIDREMEQVRNWERQLRQEEESAIGDQERVEAKRVELEKAERDFEARKSLIEETKGLLAAGKERVKGMLQQKLGRVAQIVGIMERERQVVEEQLASLGLGGGPQKQVDGGGGDGNGSEADVKPTPTVTKNANHTHREGATESNIPIILRSTILSGRRDESLEPRQQPEPFNTMAAYEPSSPTYKLNEVPPAFKTFGSGGFKNSKEYMSICPIFGSGGFGNKEDFGGGGFGLGAGGASKSAHEPRAAIGYYGDGSNFFSFSTRPSGYAHTNSDCDNTFGKEGGSGNSGAFYSDSFGKFGTAGGSATGGSGSKCFNCGEEGHVKSDCPNPKRDSGGAGSGNTGLGGGQARNSIYDSASQAWNAHANTNSKATGGFGNSAGFGNSGFSNIAAGSSGGGGPKCFTCGEEGHRNTNCPNKKREAGKAGFGNSGFGDGGFGNSGYEGNQFGISAYGKALAEMNRRFRDEPFGNGNGFGNSGGLGYYPAYNSAAAAGDGGDGPKCFQCGGVGHRKADCPTAKPHVGFGGGSDRNCIQFGHMSRECPEPRKPRCRNSQMITCRACNQEGHSSVDCPTAYNDSDWD